MVAMAPQATSWQPTTCDTIQGETIKASVVELRGDLPGLQELLMAKLNRNGRRLCLLSWEDFPPPIGIGGGDSIAATKALAEGDTTVQWPSRKAVHQLGTWPATSTMSRP